MTERTVAVYRVLGALGAATHWRHSFAFLDGYEYVGELTEAEAQAVPLTEIPDPNWPTPGRWECSSCGGRHVQVTLPFWYRELSPENPDEYRVGSLQPVGVDEDADPMWWYCEDCEETGSGRPMEADDGLRGAWVDGDIEGSRKVED